MDGAGKTTQIKHVAEFLTKQKIAFITTREPGGCAFGEKLRPLLLEDPDVREPLSQALGMMAGRVQHVAETIKPALAKGQWVLCDRFNDSTLVYQGFVAGVPLEVLDQLYQTTLGGFKPDLTCVLMLDPKEAKKRIQARVKNAYDEAPLSFYQKVARGFAWVCQQNPHRCVALDGTLEETAITKAIIAHLETYAKKEKPAL